MTKGDKIAKMYHEHQSDKLKQAKVKYFCERGIPTKHAALSWTKPNAMIPIANYHKTEEFKQMCSKFREILQKYFLKADNK
jgi:hypothetical protein